MTTAAASGNAPLAAHLRMIRTAADLIEQAGIPGLAVYPHEDEIVLQVPQASGDAGARAAQIARLAALAGCEPQPDPGPGRTRGWLDARGMFAGCPVHIFAPFTQEENCLP